MHPLVQWHRLVRLPDDNPYGQGEWPGNPPDHGRLDEAALAALLELLRPHTTTPDECWFCLWDGYGGINGSGVVVTAVLEGSDQEPSVQPMPPAFPSEVLDGPRVRLPGRNYLLFHGPLVTAPHLGYGVTTDWFDAYPPNLFWPDDHAWCVGSEIDFDSTLVGGSAALIGDILNDPKLEAWRVSPEDLLTVDGDRVNPPL